jgi:hypothetical protein
MGKLVEGFKKFRNKVFGEDGNSSVVSRVISISTGDVWVYDFDKHRFSPLLDEKPGWR